MNRATALLLAMATLLAHALAVHRDENGSFGQPYEVAHEAYHLGQLGMLRRQLGKPGLV